MTVNLQRSVMRNTPTLIRLTGPAIYYRLFVARSYNPNRSELLQPVCDCLLTIIVMDFQRTTLAFVTTSARDEWARTGSLNDFRLALSRN